MRVLAAWPPGSSATPWFGWAISGALIPKMRTRWPEQVIVSPSATWGERQESGAETAGVTAASATNQAATGMLFKINATGSPMFALWDAMAPYTIDLYDEHGGVRERQNALFAQDDDAIDHAGRLGHPNEIKVWQGERLVAHFPPLAGTLAGS